MKTACELVCCNVMKHNVWWDYSTILLRHRVPTWYWKHGKSIEFQNYLEIDRYIGRYLGFTDILVSAKMANFISHSRCWQNTVIFLMHADNLRKKTQWTNSRQLPCSKASKCVFINKQTRWIMKHMSAVAAETKASWDQLKITAKYWNCCNL